MNTTNSTAAITERAQRILSFHRVTVTSVQPAPYTAPVCAWSRSNCCRKKLIPSIMKKINPRTPILPEAILRSCLKLVLSNCFFGLGLASNFLPVKASANFPNISFALPAPRLFEPFPPSPKRWLSSSKFPPSTFSAPGGTVSLNTSGVLTVNNMV